MTTQQTFQELVDRVGVATDKLETAVTAVELGTGEITVLVERAEQAEAGAIAASEIANEAAVDAVAAKDVILNTTLLPEAPQDGKTYGRNNAAWVEVIAGGGGSGTVQSVNEITPDEEGNVTLTPANIGAANATHTHTSTQISDSTAIGRSVLTATTASLARTAIGAGTSSLELGTTASTAAAGNHTHNLASGSTNGFMSATDKNKLNAIEAEATKGADWNTNVTNKPTIPTNTNQLTNGAGFITEAPDDNKEYVRKSKAWVEASSGGGGSAGWPFPFPNYENGWEYEVSTGVWEPIDTWPTTNPFLAVPMTKMRRPPSAGLPNTGSGATPDWNQMFSLSSYFYRIPPGIYQFISGNFTTGPLSGLGGGFIYVTCGTGGVGSKKAWAEIRNATTGMVTVYDHVAGTIADQYKWTKRTALA